MIYFFLFLWLLSTLLMILEHKITRILIYLGIFSLLTSICFLLFSAPDVAMAEAAISTFSTVFFIICFEKHYGFKNSSLNQTDMQEKIISGGKKFFKILMPLLFSIFLFGLFVYSIPSGEASSLLKDQYLARFINDVGGENAVTAIYLGYRMYDTLFEALMLLASVVAVSHLSHFDETIAEEGDSHDITRSVIGSFTIRAISPLILVFGVYLIFNGHLTPGGGFQGGVALASFFVCRYMLYKIYDTKAERFFILEKITFSIIILLPVLFIFMGLYNYYPQYRHAYLIAMNSLIGMKVCFGFMVIFYRYIAFEKR